jgi:hypothetical protein
MLPDREGSSVGQIHILSCSSVVLKSNRPPITFMIEARGSPGPNN